MVIWVVVHSRLSCECRPGRDQAVVLVTLDLGRWSVVDVGMTGRVLAVGLRMSISPDRPGTVALVLDRSHKRSSVGPHHGRRGNRPDLETP